MLRSSDHVLTRNVIALQSKASYLNEKLISPTIVAFNMTMLKPRKAQETGKLRSILEWDGGDMKNQLFIK